MNHNYNIDPPISSDSVMIHDAYRHLADQDRHLVVHSWCLMVIVQHDNYDPMPPQRIVEQYVEVDPALTDNDSLIFFHLSNPQLSLTPVCYQNNNYVNRLRL